MDELKSLKEEQKSPRTGRLYVYEEAPKGNIFKRSFKSLFPLKPKFLLTIFHFIIACIVGFAGMLSSMAIDFYLVDILYEYGVGYRSAAPDSFLPHSIAGVLSFVLSFFGLYRIGIRKRLRAQI
ncbi:hypothetical protein [Dinoroseobacter sp. S76]|uniref:hypothetical protein n=1 Tax=Dinoroseobacter sp. S76 TaxID=3415124 RepID=UPI003C7AEE07